MCVKYADSGAAIQCRENAKMLSVTKLLPILSSEQEPEGGKAGVSAALREAHRQKGLVS